MFRASSSPIGPQRRKRHDERPLLRGLHLLSREEVLIEPEGDAGRALVHPEVHPPGGRRGGGGGGGLQQAAVHGEARQLAGQLERVEVGAALVSDEGLKEK